MVVIACTHSKTLDKRKVGPRMLKLLPYIDCFMEKVTRDSKHVRQVPVKAVMGTTSKQTLTTVVHQGVDVTILMLCIRHLLQQYLVILCNTGSN